jgi:hypothetical protein
LFRLAGSDDGPIKRRPSSEKKQPRRNGTDYDGWHWMMMTRPSSPCCCCLDCPWLLWFLMMRFNWEDLVLCSACPTDRSIVTTTARHHHHYQRSIWNKTRRNKSSTPGLNKETNPSTRFPFVDNDDFIRPKRRTDHGRFGSAKLFECVLWIIFLAEGSPNSSTKTKNNRFAARTSHE